MDDSDDDDDNDVGDDDDGTWPISAVLDCIKSDLNMDDTVDKWYIYRRMWE